MATDHNFKVKNGLDVLGGAATISGGHLTLTSNSYGVNTRSVLARDTNGLNLGTSNGTTALSINNSGNITMPYNLTVTGNLTVNGTTTTLNTATLDVEDKNITLNYGSGDTSGSANGAGITIQDAVSSSTDATILWDATNDKFDFSHPIQIKSGTAASSPNIFRILSDVESNTDKGDVYAGIELGVNGAENSTGNITNGVVAAIKAVDFRNGSTSYEDSGLGFYTLGTGDSSTVFRGGFSNEGGLHISNDAVLDAVGQGNLQVDGITYANGGLYVSGVQILNTSGSVVAQTFDATDRDFVVTDNNESTTNIIWKDDSAGKLYLGTSTFPAEFRSDINLQTGLAFKMNGTTVVDSSRNAILQGLRASTTESATSSTGINFTATDSVSNQNFTAVRIDHNASGSQTHTTDNSHYALFVDQDSSASGGDTTNEHRLYGIYSDQRISASGDSDVMYSIYGYSESQHSSGQVSGVYAGYFIGKADDTGTGHTSNVYGVLGQAQADNTGSGGTSNLYGVYGKSLLSTACDKNTNLATGVYAEVEIDDPGQAQTLSAAYVVRAEYDDDSAGNVTVTNGYMFYGNVAGTAATNMYGMYFADDLRHHFKGTLEARGADTDISTALAYGFASDRNTGMYSPANHAVGFATNGTERGRLSGSDWLFHKQTSGLDGGGVEFATGGRSRFTRDGANVIEINRKTSAGSLVTLYNGASNLIGQINTTNNLMALGTGAAGLIFNDSSDAIYPWNVAGGTGSDASLDLGLSTRRWRDMYLGRTLYMNGGDIDLRNDTSGDNSTIRAINFKTTGANGTDDRVALISATTSGGTSTTRGGKLRFFTRDPNADSFNEIHVTNAGNLNIVDGGLQTAGTQRINNSGALTNISTATLSGSIYSNIAAGGTSIYLDTTTNASSGSTLYGPGIRWRQDDQTSIAGIRGAVSSDGTNQLILGTGWLDQEVFIEPSRVRISGDLQVDGNDVKLAATNKRVKYSVWSNDTYGIGMHNTVTYGGINNDYAMTFQMNNDVDRGWLFFDSDDTLAQGAMALTTEGKLTVADSIRLGYGKNDTTSPGLNSLDLEVSGTSKFDSQIRAGSGSETLPAFSFASDTNTGFYRAGENDLAVATAGDTHARFTNDAFQIEGGAGLRLKAGGRSDNPEGTYYNWFQTGAGTDTTTFYKICDVDINTGLYRALAMHIRVKSIYGNYGSTGRVAFSEYTAAFTRSGGVQDDQGTPTLSGYNTDNHELRIYKTGTGEYELQARMKATYRDLIVELQVLNTNGGTVTMNESLSAGTTSGGTAYTATEHTSSTAPEFYTGKLAASSLGIGTTSPSEKLHITSGSTNSNTLTLIEPGTTAGNYSALQVGRTDGSSNVQVADAVSGGIPISGTAGILLGSNSTSLPAVGIRTPNSSSGHIVFNPKGTEKVRITADGNVGIGLTNPSRKLTVYDASAPYLALQNSDTGTTNSDGFQIQMAGLDGYVFNYENGDLFLGAGGVTRITAKSDGTVGIGTTSPSQKLDVNGNTTSTAYILRGNGSAPTADAAIFRAADNTLAFSTGSSERMRIDSSGRVGIGTTSPSADLHIEDSSGATLFMGDTNGRNLRFRTANSGSQNTNISSYAGLYLGGADNQNHMLIDGNGKVGIGTSSLTNKFHVSGDARIEGNLMAGDAAASNVPVRPLHVKSSGDAAAIRIEDTTSTNLAYDIRSTHGTGLLFVDVTGGATRMTITSSGVTTTGAVRAEVASYASNQDVAYMIAGTSGYTGATTNWNTFGMQHRLKTSSGGTPRVTIDTPNGEQFSVDNNGNMAVASGITTGGSLSFTANPATIQNSEDNSGQIIISVKNSSGSAQKVRWDAGNASSGAWRPEVTNVSNLGLTNRIWNTLYVNNIRMGSGNDLFVDANRNITTGTISSGAISASGAVHTFNGGSSDYAATFSSDDAYSGIRFQDPDGSGTVYYRGATNHLYLHNSTFSVAGSTIATNFEFQVNGDANLTGGLAIGGNTVITSARNMQNIGTISSGAITSSGVTTTLGDSGTNGTINMRASSNFYLQQDGNTRATLNSAGITSSANVYTGSTSSFRNYGGTWSATTGLTGNGFTFSNSVDGTAMTISSTGDVVCTGSLSATTKSFDIEHPTKEGMRLHHGSLEGPEHGVYIRGRNKGTVIELPEYWLGLVDEDTITVQLTAIGEPQNLCVADIKDNKVYVKGVEYFYFIQAERKDIEKFEVEYAV